MADIKVTIGQQQDAIRVISSSIVASAKLEDVTTDVNIDNRGDRTFLMYDSASETYIHVPAHQIVDLSDGVDDESYDGGTF